MSRSQRDEDKAWIKANPEKYRELRRWERHLGLVVRRSPKRGYPMLWTDDGLGWWLPDPIKRGIVALWNTVACRVWGHEDYGFGSCPNCCAPLPEDPEVMRALHSD